MSFPVPLLTVPALTPSPLLLAASFFLMKGQADSKETFGVSGL